MVRTGPAPGDEAPRDAASPRNPRTNPVRFLAMNSYPNALGPGESEGGVRRRLQPPSGTRGERLMIYESILGTIGNTPVVRINKLAPPNVTMYVKCEAFNPLSSVKDRLAIAIIEDAERTGAL